MRYLIIFLVVFLISPLGSIEAAGPPNCTLDSSGRITNVDVGGSNDFCRLSPSELQITVKYIGLCTSAPSVSTYRSVCTSIFENSSGETVTLTSGGSLPLAGSVALPEGTYTHAWVLIDNTVKIKILAQFTPDRTGRSGTGAYCWTLAGDSSGGSGAVNESTSQSSWLAECGSQADSDPQLTSSTMVAFFDFSALRFTNSSSGTNSSGSYDVYLIDSAGNESVVAANGSSSNPASDIGGKQTFTNPVSISPTTTSIDVGFRLENNGGVLFGTVSGDTTHIPRFGLGGFEFRFQSN